MRSSATGFGRVLALAAALWAVPFGVAAQDFGSVTGQVRDAATLQPIASAQVQIVSTEQGGLSNSNGRFLLNRVPVGTQQLRVVVLGYAQQIVDITVTAGQVTEVTVDLETSAISLDEIVITATGEQRARQVVNKISQIDAASIVESSQVTTVSDLLVGKTAGVQIIGSSGAVGTGQRIRIRGSSSISLSNEPVIFVDGIRIESGANSGSIGVGGQVPSRLNDLNPEEIESIEIVRGPSAATLYGTDAANGVIRITTKKGQLGSASFAVYAETGIVQDNNTYPANYGSPDGCFAFEVGQGACTQSSLDIWNPLEESISTPFKTGNRQQYGVNVTGGSERLNYFVSGEWETSTGVLGLPEFDEANLREEFGDAFDDLPKSLTEPNALDRLSLRANFGGSITESLNFNARAGYVASDLQLPNNDNNVLGLLPSALLGGTEGTEDASYGYGFFLPSEVNFQNVEQEVRRFTGSGAFDWQPIDWLTGRATVGLDQLTRTDVENVPRERIFFGATRPLGQRTVNTARITNVTVDVGFTADFQLYDWLTSRTTAGTQFFSNLFTRADAFGADVVAGCNSLTCTSSEFAVDETTTESRTLGVFVDQEFGINDRLFINAAVRLDDNSAFGADFDAIVYPKLGASWVVSEEEFFPDFDQVSSFRVRTAWGASGAQPGPTDALRFFNATAVTVDGQDVAGVTIGELGNPELEPEQSSEIELGFDLGLFNERATFNLTYYNKTTTDLLIEQPLPPSGGVGDDRFVNLGEVTNSGWELGLDTRILESPTLIWDLGLQFATNENELVDLGNLPNGDPIPEIKTGEQWYTEGYPMAGYWDFPITFDDANGDGIIDVSEITIGEEEVYLGSAIPTRDISANTSVTLWNKVRLNALLDYRGGHKLHNLTESFRCQFAICEGLYETGASLEEQARALAVTFTDVSTEDGFIEDASFTRLRELGATFFLPEEWAARFGASRATFTATGRNLLIFTDYTGADPEVNGTGNSNFRIRDFLTQPPVRTFVFRVNLNF
ncbi:MAG: SusC/RagA family TonB-linked outer membrane protein [Gemmatimonadetes bacterium]|nr:SusC/RagA family TonB-linked outer membrane protein [Gemmatimonadota bacterium]